MPMNMVQPPARDYVPRRSGEIAVSLLQAYALFHHNTYDAGGICFVPSNVTFAAGPVMHVTCSTNGKAEAQSLLDSEESSREALPLAALSPARIRRCTSARKYLRRFSGTMPGAANSRRSETVSSGR